VQTPQGVDPPQFHDRKLTVTEALGVTQRFGAGRGFGDLAGMRLDRWLTSVRL
jgi:hypothetical protein